MSSQIKVRMCVRVCESIVKCTELKCYSIEMFNIFFMQANRCEWVNERVCVRACMRVSTKYTNIKYVHVYVWCMYMFCWFKYGKHTISRHLIVILLSVFVYLHAVNQYLTIDSMLKFKVWCVIKSVCVWEHSSSLYFVSHVRTSLPTK